jgi:3-phenylpropionate/trans-cinnamate dioxygenase ferredoxin reductase subunit
MHLDAGRRELTIAMGAQGATGIVKYERLVIATGAAPIRLPIEPEGVLRLRRVEDADRIREAAKPGARVGIIGAGAIGVELATSLNALGCEVTVLDKADRPLERLLAGHLGTEVTGWLDSLGVDCRWGVDIERIDGEPGDWTVRLGDGEELRFDALIGAVGARPIVGWLESSGLLTDGQLVCDEFGRVLAPGESPDGVFGIGDVVTRRLSNGSLMRTESWSAAGEQGRQIAEVLLGRNPADAEIAYFWTDVAGRKVQVLGSLRRDGELSTEFENEARGAVLYRVAVNEEDGGWIGVNAPAQIAMRRIAGTVV